MEDKVENQSANLEIATPETENHVVPAQETKVEASKEVTDDRQDRNWRLMRERQKELERELKREREVNERILQMQAQNSPSKPLEVDELDAIGDEEFIPKGKVHKLVRKEAERIARDIAQKEAERLFQQQHQAQFMDRLKRQYSDFDDVVNAETLSLLEEQEPELANTIAETKDPYKMGVQSYKYIKAMNLSAKAPEARRSREVEKKLEKNANIVQTPQAYDKRPMAEAYRMTDVEKKKLYEDMMGHASRAGGGY